MTETETQTAEQSTLTSDGAQTLPGELQACYVVLLERHEAAIEAQPATDEQPAVPAHEAYTWFEQLGHVNVPVGTKRSTVLRIVQDGQHKLDSDIPQVTLGDGERGALHVIPEEEFGAGVSLRGVQRIVFVPAGGGEGA